MHKTLTRTFDFYVDEEEIYQIWEEQRLPHYRYNKPDRDCIAEDIACDLLWDTNPEITNNLDAFGEEWVDENIVRPLTDYIIDKYNLEKSA